MGWTALFLRFMLLLSKFCSVIKGFLALARLIGSSESLKSSYPPNILTGITPDRRYGEFAAFCCNITALLLGLRLYRKS